MAGVNKAFLIGNLTKDPELKYAQNGGTAVAVCGIAVNETWTDGNGQKQERVLFIDTVCFGKQAESMAQYCKKGKQVHLEGRIQLDTWEDRETGTKRSKHKILIDRITFLGSGEGGGQQQGGGQNRGGSVDRRPAGGGQQGGGQQQGGVDFDDIPF